MRSLLERIRNWYKGSYHPIREELPGGGLAVREVAYYEKSTSAKIATRLVQFWIDNWKWLLGFAVATAYIAYLKL
jgi:hypothetical protein